MLFVAQNQKRQWSYTTTYSDANMLTHGFTHACTHPWKSTHMHEYTCINKLKMQNSEELADSFTVGRVTQYQLPHKILEHHCFIVQG